MILNDPWTLEMIKVYLSRKREHFLSKLQFLKNDRESEEEIFFLEESEKEISSFLRDKEKKSKILPLLQKKDELLKAYDEIMIKTQEFIYKIHDIVSYYKEKEKIEEYYSRPNLSSLEKSDMYQWFLIEAQVEADFLKLVLMLGDEKKAVQLLTKKLDIIYSFLIKGCCIKGSHYQLVELFNNAITLLKVNLTTEKQMNQFCEFLEIISPIYEKVAFKMKDVFFDYDFFRSHIFSNFAYASFNRIKDLKSIVNELFETKNHKYVYNLFDVIAYIVFKFLDKHSMWEELSKLLENFAFVGKYIKGNAVKTNYFGISFWFTHPDLASSADITFSKFFSQIPKFNKLASTSPNWQKVYNLLKKFTESVTSEVISFLSFLQNLNQPFNEQCNLTLIWLIRDKVMLATNLVFKSLVSALTKGTEEEAKKFAFNLEEVLLSWQNSTEVLLKSFDEKISKSSVTECFKKVIVFSVLPTIVKALFVKKESLEFVPLKDIYGNYSSAFFNVAQRAKILLEKEEPFKKILTTNELINACNDYISISKILDTNFKKAAGLLYIEELEHAKREVKNAFKKNWESGFGIKL